MEGSVYKVSHLFDSGRRQKAKEYNKRKNKVDVILRVIFFIFWLTYFLRWGRGLAEQLEGAGLNIWTVHGLLITLTLLISFLVFGSAEYFLGYKLDRQYGLATEGPSCWWQDKIKVFILHLILFNAGAVVFRILFLSTYRWWFYLGLITAIFFVLLNYLFPVLILPLFYRLSPYPDNQLRRRLEGLLKKLHVEVEDIYEINLSKKVSGGNAMVMGLGNTRKIALGDTLREEYNDGEIEAIMAHELGHHLLHHYSKKILIFVFQLLLTLWLASLALSHLLTYVSLEHNAIFTTMLFGLVYWFFDFIFRPVILYISRVMETEADRFALMVIKVKDDFINSMVKLGDQHLAPLRPPLWKLWFSYSHPPIGDRVAFGLKVKDDSGK